MHVVITTESQDTFLMSYSEFYTFVKVLVHRSDDNGKHQNNQGSS